ncbi:MAG TPA: ATP-binding protein [Sediminispirochaeta sp.]|nr:ATP-binding protein [Sediminispirochaeta sp.]
MAGHNTQDTQAQDARLKERMADIKHKILVLSGKGGVGKTTMSVNFALALAEKGYQVGLMDTDLHGPNVAKMLGADEAQLMSYENGIEPFEVIKNLKVVSLSMAGHGPDTPVIWRGPLKIGVIKQFLADVNWGKLDYLVIDTPPGTGDEPLTVAQLIPELDGSIVVTTPQQVAILDSRKSINFSKQLNIPVLGVVENMSGLLCPHCGQEIPLFGKDGGRIAAEEMEVPFLGPVPMEQALMEAEDSGTHFILDSPDSISAKALREIIEKVVKAIG